MDNSGRLFQVKPSHQLGLFLPPYSWDLQVGIAAKDGNCRSQVGGLNHAHFLQGSCSLASCSALKPLKATNKLWESYITVNKNSCLNYYAPLCHYTWALQLSSQFGKYPRSFAGSFGRSKNLG